MPVAFAFAKLTPDFLLEAVEVAMDRPFTGLAHPQPSYINRVYELQAVDGERLIAKFYRPDRWSMAAIRQEHAFLAACADAEVPVIAPLPLAGGDTLADADGIPLAIFPKRWGRQLEVTDEEGWLRLGRLLARGHLQGRQVAADRRIRMHPETETRRHLEYLVDGILPERHAEALRPLAHRIMTTLQPLFEGVRMQPIHGDCHANNVLERPGEGLMLIDFDDMCVGPPVQDLWMLLPGPLDETREEFTLMVCGYEEFAEFDWFTQRLVEPLRLMRILYFEIWVAHQRHDPGFREHHPDWGSDAYWQHRIADLQQQLNRVHQANPGL